MQLDIELTDAETHNFINIIIRANKYMKSVLFCFQNVLPDK